ncbi:hypothetical protein CAPTEDRAFT_184986 [Capitella teleta]|uniref:LRRCT domain-containing protein n=1 Tax=Capitella teleta TaxID=283909 RepID=R7T5D4_CAPTE|nr:hypothetical protein CAPTEDRAFT_184986 [Capitella teleta]|eukprot:ELT88544.1 hypothetical protein CAPTEDRAFT_184986 [Capitella teleta]
MMCLRGILLVATLGLVHGVFVDYENRNLLSVSTASIPDDVTILNLQRNQISSVPAHSFSRCPELADLNMSYNRITFVDKDAFTGTVIAILKIKFNDLTAVPDLSAIKATLTFLSVHSNKVTDIDNMMFFDNLEILYAGDNNISTFDSNLFAEMSKIEIIGLANNAIASLDVLLSAHPNHIVTVYMKDNPALKDCTCYLVNVLQRLDQKLKVLGDCLFDDFTTKLDTLTVESMCSEMRNTIGKH